MPDFSQISVNLEGLPILGPHFPKNMNEKNFEKINANKLIEQAYRSNKHIEMYSCTKFQLNLENFRLWDQICPTKHKLKKL